MILLRSRRMRMEFERRRALLRHSVGFTQIFLRVPSSATSSNGPGSCMLLSGRLSMNLNTLEATVRLFDIIVIKHWLSHKFSIHYLCGTLPTASRTPEFMRNATINTIGPFHEPQWSRIDILQLCSLILSCHYENHAALHTCLPNIGHLVYR
ncbi:hypothetical protein BD410DRAFT_290383 [Rickenella mellea]|uniref:Uncharacterized protein n=1 Tax=Rickenella mellea TaxID=50990 RepID=A0A4Y7Q3F0_9AGAM|nr:hypothetical protein BD410DRAFT_290383 [Rickenella mellea]